jgi:hypothetical protein
MLKVLNLTNQSVIGHCMTPSTRSKTGSIALEYVAALVILFLVLCFPLMNLATVTYKYNLVVAAVHTATNRAAKADTFSGTGNAIAALVPATVSNFLNNVKGVQVQQIDYRINESDPTTTTVTHYPMRTRLSTVPDVRHIYCVETIVAARVDPLIYINVGFIPSIPGLTGPASYTVASQEIVENVTGLNQ